MGTGRLGFPDLRRRHLAVILAVMPVSPPPQPISVQVLTTHTVTRYTSTLYLGHSMAIDLGGVAMDVQTVRQELEDTRKRLAHVEREREVLLDLQRGFEGWLQFQGALVPAELVSSGGGATPVVDKESAAEPVSRRPNNRTKGSIPFTDAVRQVLEEANGRSLTRATIAERAQQRGARSESRDVRNLVDSLCKRMHGVEKGTSPGTWRKAPAP